MFAFLKREKQSVETDIADFDAKLEAEIKKIDTAASHIIHADILDHAAGTTDGVLDKAKTARDEISAQIVNLKNRAAAAAKAYEAEHNDLTEKLRHTGVVIAAFEAAQAALVAGSDPSPANAPAPMQQPADQSAPVTIDPAPAPAAA